MLSLFAASRDLREACSAFRVLLMFSMAFLFVDSSPFKRLFEMFDFSPFAVLFCIPWLLRTVGLVRLFVFGRDFHLFERKPSQNQL